MSDTIGNITVPEIAASGTFPIVPEYPYGRASHPDVAIHQFGSGNAKIEQRFLLGTGARRFSVRRTWMNDAQRIALRNFWESKYGPYGAFTYNAPNDDGNGTTAFTCRFANEPLSWQMVADWVCSVGVTLVEIPAGASGVRAQLDGDAVPFGRLAGRSPLAGPAGNPAHQDPAPPGRVPRHLSLRPALHGRRATLPGAPDRLRRHLAGHGQRVRRRLVHVWQRRSRDARPRQRRGPVPCGDLLLAVPRRPGHQARSVEGRHRQLDRGRGAGVQGHGVRWPVRTEPAVPDAQDLPHVLEGLRLAGLPVRRSRRARSGPLPRQPTRPSATRVTTPRTGASRTG